MARTVERLTSLQVERAKSNKLKPGMHADGAGLYLKVSDGGASWVLRYMLNGSARYMGLGPLALYGLAEARASALEAKRLRHRGIDPIAARRTERVRLRLEAVKAFTFGAAAETYIRTHEAGWRNEKHIHQWTNTLAAYAEPIIGSLPVQTIDTALVIKILEPIWTTKPETASRLRGRIENILDWAKVRGYREGENPARWRGHLDKLLPATDRVRRIEHHAALSYAEIGDFMTALRDQEGVGARALEFAVLTATRTGEAIGATWREVDLAGKLWTISANRMKAGREHRVPLSARAVEILDEMKPLRQPAEGQNANEAFVFPGRKRGLPLSNMAFLMLLRRIGRDDLTAHGFRSTFRDWCAERTSYPGEVAEMALAHAVSDKVEAAYRRGDLFDRCRKLMAAWATFCVTAKPTTQSNVAPMRPSA